MLMWVLLIVGIRPVHPLWATPAFICLVYILPLQIDFFLFHPASLPIVSLLFECHNHASRVVWYIFEWVFQYQHYSLVFVSRYCSLCQKNLLCSCCFDVFFTMFDVWSFPLKYTACSLIKSYSGIYLYRIHFSPSTKIFLIVQPSSIFIGSKFI